jgi:hypothetical protein
MAAKAVSVTGSRRTAEADFDISVFQGAFSAEYKIPGKVSCLPMAANSVMRWNKCNKQQKC